LKKEVRGGDLRAAKESKKEEHELLGKETK